MKHVTRTLFLTTAVIAALQPLPKAFAATGATAPLPPQVQTEMPDTSPEALAAVAHVQAARLALMNADFTQAREHIENAIAALSAGQGMVDPAAIPDTGAAASGDPVYLPFSVAVVAAGKEGLTRENLLALQKAYGDPATAQPGDTLLVPHLDQIDVAVTAALLPADESMAHLLEARKFLDAGQVVEANRALLSLERSIVVRTYALDAAPAQSDIQ